MEQAEVDDTPPSRAETGTILAMAEAQAKSAHGPRRRHQGRDARQSRGARPPSPPADNTLSSEVIRMRIDMARLRGPARHRRQDDETGGEDRQHPHQSHHRIRRGRRRHRVGLRRQGRWRTRWSTASSQWRCSCPPSKSSARRSASTSPMASKACRTAASDTDTNDPTPPEANEDGDTNDKN